MDLFTIDQHITLANYFFQMKASTKICLLVALLLATASTSSYAQDLSKVLTLKSEKIGDATLEVVYRYTIYDPVLEKSQEGHDIVQVGAKIDLYYDYGHYQEQHQLSKQDWKVTQLEWNQMYDEYGIQTRVYWLVIDKEQEVLTEKDSRAGTSCYYEEKIPRIAWRLIPTETKEILGHKCTKAIADFRGREWQVWFASDIDRSGGPWKLRGLPGFILAAETGDGEYKYEAVTIRTSKGIPMYVGKLSKNTFKTNRQQFNIQMARGAWQFSETIVARGLPMPSSESSRARLFYNPRELDWIDEYNKQFKK